MSASERAEVLAVVAASPLSKSQILAEMGIPRRTYYNWVRREKESNTRGMKIENRRPWNKVEADEEKLVIDQARASPELSPRQRGTLLVKSIIGKHEGQTRCGLPIAAI